MQIPTAQTLPETHPIALQLLNKLPVQGTLRLSGDLFPSHTATLVNLLATAILIASRRDKQRKVMDAFVLISVLDNNFPIEIKKTRLPFSNLKPDTIIVRWPQTWYPYMTDFK